MTHRSLDPGHFEARRTRGPKGQRFTPSSRTASSDAPCVRNTATSCCDRVAPPMRSLRVWPTADAPGFRRPALTRAGRSHWVSYRAGTREDQVTFDSVVEDVRGRVNLVEIDLRPYRPEQAGGRSRTLPVPQGAKPVVHGRPREGLLSLLRMWRGRGRVQVRDGDPRAFLPGGARAACTAGWRRLPERRRPKVDRAGDVSSSRSRALRPCSSVAS